MTGVQTCALPILRVFQTVWHSPEEPLVAEPQVVTPRQAVRQAVPSTDMRLGEYILFVPLVVLVIVLGVAPILVTGVLDSTVSDWLNQTAALLTPKR